MCEIRVTMLRTKLAETFTTNGRSIEDIINDVACHFPEMEILEVPNSIKMFYKGISHLKKEFFQIGYFHKYFSTFTDCYCNGVVSNEIMVLATDGDLARFHYLNRSQIFVTKTVDVENGNFEKLLKESGLK